MSGSDAAGRVAHARRGPRERARRPAAELLPIFRGVGFGTPLVFGVVVAPVLGYVLIMLATQAEYRAAGPFIRRELPGHCRGCGYDRRGNAGGACPECGRAAVATPAEGTP